MPRSHTLPRKIRKQNIAPLIKLSYETRLCDPLLATTTHLTGSQSA